MTRTLALIPPETPSSVPPEFVLLGLPLVRRTALAAARAGFDRVVVADPTPGIRAALAGTPAELGAPAPPGAMALPWNVVVAVRDLEKLASGGAAPGVPVASAQDLPRAEKFLLRGLIKDTEGFMSRHVERRLSLAVSRRLAATRVTPNAMTLISVGVGVLGALFFLRAEASTETVGALLFLLHSILDGCDGELARLKFQESRYGGLLDFWGDNVVHSAVFACMAVGWSRATHALWPLFLGALAVAGTLASAFFVFRRTMGAQKRGPLYTSVATAEESRLSRMADAISRRDFIYLVLILSAFGKARWFLALTAAGAPMYFVVLLAIAAGERRARGVAHE